MTNVSPEQPPALEAIEAVATTIANPCLPVLAEDLLLVHQIVSQVKGQLAGKHPGVLDIFRLLFNLA